MFLSLIKVRIKKYDKLILMNAILTDDAKPSSIFRVFGDTFLESVWRILANDYVSEKKKRYFYFCQELQLKITDHLVKNC